MEKTSAQGLFMRCGFKIEAIKFFWLRASHPFKAKMMVN